MRLLTVFAFSLFLGFAHAQEQPSAPNPALKVTFSEPAAPLSRLMPHLAELTKLPLKVTKAMETEVVLVSVHDVTADELLKRIAAATGGKWGQSENTYYLSPSTGAREALKGRAFNARAVKLAVDLKKLDPANKKPDVKPTPGQIDMSMMMGARGDAVFYQLLSAIGPRQLAGMLPGDRAVLSTKPMGRQYSLPPCDEAIAAYIARRNKEADKAAAKTNNGTEDGDVAASATGFNPFGPAQPVKGRPAKVILILTRTEGIGAIIGNGELSCELVLYDAAGKELSRDSANLGSFFDSDEMQELMATSTGKATPTTDPQLEVSPATKQFTKYLRSMQMGAGQNPSGGMSADLQKQMRDRLMHPEAFDPVAYPADLLAAYAKAKNLQLVASLPDSFGVWLISLMMSSTTSARVEKKLSNDTGLVIDVADGWLTIAPGDFRSEPMNRVDLANILASLSGETNPSIDQLAAAALAGLGDPDHGMLPELWMALASPGLATLFAEDWDMLRVYGALSADQKAVLSSAKRLSVTALTEPQKAQLERMIYGASSGISFFTGEAPLHVEAKRDEGSILGAADSMFSDALEQYGVDGESSKDYRGEPTEVAPNGLPAGAAITLKMGSSQVLEPEIKDKSTTAATAYNQPMGVEQLAGMVAMKDSPQFAQMSSYLPAFNRVKIGTKRSLHFRIYVSADSFKVSTLSDCAFPPGESYALNNLPGALQKKFDEALKQLRAAYGNMGNTVVGQGGAAPPR